MKNIFLGLFVAAFTVSIYSCRQTTEENTETTIEEVETEIDNTYEETEYEVEEIEEVEETDDI